MVTPTARGLLPKTDIQRGAAASVGSDSSDRGIPLIAVTGLAAAMAIGILVFLAVTVGLGKELGMTRLKGQSLSNRMEMNYGS